MKENWYAFCVSILTNKATEEALGAFGIIQEHNTIHKQRIHNADSIVREMYDLKLKGYKLQEIGDRFGLSAESVRLKIYRYKQKLKAVS